MGFTAAAYSVPDSDGSVTVCVGVRSSDETCMLEDSITLTISTSDGTAGKILIKISQ